MEEFQNNYFFRPLFIIISWPKILLFVIYSILTGDTKVEFVIYWVLSVKSSSQLFKSNRRTLQLQHWRIYGYLHFKMGTTGFIFQLNPPNFANQYNFSRWSNDVAIFFFFFAGFRFANISVECSILTCICPCISHLCNGSNIYVHHVQVFHLWYSLTPTVLSIATNKFVFRVNGKTCDLIESHYAISEYSPIEKCDHRCEGWSRVDFSIHESFAQSIRSPARTTE